MATLLIVEDSPQQAEIISDCLQKSGYTVLLVTTAEAAKGILEQKTVDGIILDVVLPGQSGFGLCRDLKTQDKTAHIPIIICSSKSEKMDQKWAIKQGASAYVTKPIDTAELLNTVKILIPG